MTTTNTALTWVLVISTFLIGGKAIGLLDISWTVAFAPIVLLLILTLVAFVISFVLMYTVLNKKIDEKDGNDRA